MFNRTDQAGQARIARLRSRTGWFRTRLRDYVHRNGIQLERNRFRGWKVGFPFGLQLQAEFKDEINFLKRVVQLRYFDILNQILAGRIIAQFLQQDERIVRRKRHRVLRFCRRVGEFLRACWAETRVEDYKIISGTVGNQILCNL